MSEIPRLALLQKGSHFAASIVDEQVGAIFASLALPEHWLEAALARINIRDEVARVIAEREQLTEKLRRLAKAWIDNLVDDADYKRHKAQTEFDLTALVVPEADAVAEAGRLLRRLPELWAAADLSERRQLLLTVLDAVYVNARDAQAVIRIQPKAAFDAVLGASTTLASAFTP